MVLSKLGWFLADIFLPGEATSSVLTLDKTFAKKTTTSKLKEHQGLSKAVDFWSS